MQRQNKIRIGDLLLANGDITEEQLAQALSAQKESGQKLGRILVERGYVAEDQLLMFLSEQLGLPFVDLTEFDYDPELVARLPETYARRYRAIVLEERDTDLLVGMADPIDIFAFDEIGRALNSQISAAVVRETDLLTLLDTAYRRTSEIVSFASELEGELSVDEFTLASVEPDEEDDTPVARLLNSILEDAIQIRASDVHIEPDETVLRLRVRVDGVLQEQILNEKRISSALVSRIKLMAGLDISEKRLPQDGRFDVRIKQRHIDVRLSTLPTTYGESVVMRLADHEVEHLSLDASGMPEDMLQRFAKHIRQPHGLILVTGPTGSGKTTTLYGALTQLNSSEKKIITVEDPVELKLERINQVQVKPKIGLDFARVLRSALRQDPDILLVGEIRDAETADIALRASMTGHLVLSTLHTNDAIASAVRLLDIGVEGYIVASAVKLIVAQRLLRKVCTQCEQATSLSNAQKAWLKTIAPESHEAQVFKAGAGCNQCNRTGYSGRVGVFEMLEIDGELADALRKEDVSQFSQLAVRQPGYQPLVKNALTLAQKGVTSIAEVIALSSIVADPVGMVTPDHQTLEATLQDKADAALLAHRPSLDSGPDNSTSAH